jgi:hypothetical protein
MSVSVTMKTRKSYSFALLHIKQTISALGTDQIEVSQAMEADIQQHFMSPDLKSDQRPLFFTPYQGELESTYEPSDEPYPTISSEMKSRTKIYEPFSVPSTVERRAQLFMSG